MGSGLSVPLVLEGEAEAGLNLYSTRSHGFTDEDIDTVEAYSYHASKALRLAVRISQLAEAKTNPTAAIESRTIIDLATGAIMAQNRCSQDTAIKILKIASSTRYVKLRDIAASVVASLSQDPTVRPYCDACLLGLHGSDVGRSTSPYSPTKRSNVEVSPGGWIPQYSRPVTHVPRVIEPGNSGRSAAGPTTAVTLQRGAIRRDTLERSRKPRRQEHRSSGPAF